MSNNPLDSNEAEITNKTDSWFTHPHLLDLRDFSEEEEGQLLEKVVSGNFSAKATPMIIASVLKAVNVTAPSGMCVQATHCETSARDTSHTILTELQKLATRVHRANYSTKKYSHLKQTLNLLS